MWQSLFDLTFSRSEPKPKEMKNEVSSRVRDEREAE